MTQESDSFERMVARIQGLLKSEGATVEWSGKIEDPDNRTQLRQIDVLVRRDEFLNIVECRNYRAKQNVKWIEELIGRRISLEADGISAVSASGFTGGAIRKAAKFGIPLFDVLSLTDDEIRSWSRSMKISLFFYRYEDYSVSLGFDAEVVDKVDAELLADEFRRYYGLQAIFSSANQLLDDKKLIVEENRKKSVEFNVRFKIEDFQLQGKEVVEIETSGIAYLERMDLSIPETLSYGTPLDSVENRSVFVQQFNLGETQVVHQDGKLSISLDLSELDVPPFWQFRFCTVESAYENYHEAFELISPEKLVMKVDKVPLRIFAASNQRMQSDQPTAGR